MDSTTTRRSRPAGIGSSGPSAWPCRPRAGRAVSSGILALLLLAWIGTGCTTTSPARRDSDLAIAQGFSAMGDHREAEPYYRSVLTRRPDDYVALIGMARCRRSDGDLRGAVADLQAALRSPGATAPGARGEAEGLLGDVYLEERDYGLARVHLGRAFEKASGSWRQWVAMRLYVARRKLGDEAGARRCLAAIRDPTDPGFALLKSVHLGSMPLPVAPHRSASRPAAPRGGSTPIGAPRILSRALWKARPMRSNVRLMGRITRITIHHTGEERPWYIRGFNETAARIRAMQETHRRRGWAGLGYHFVIDRAGRIWAGRPLRYAGAHAGNTALNRGNIGIALMGNFNVQQPTPEQLQALRRLVFYLARRYHVPGSHIYAHGELKTTDCPGRFLRGYVARIRREIP